MYYSYFNKLVEALYNESINIKSVFKSSITSRIINLVKSFFKYNYNLLIYYLNSIYKAVKNEIKKIYNLNDEDFRKLEIRIVPYIPSQYKNSIALGAYSGIKNFYGRFYKGIIYLPYWLLYYPKKLIETLAHEMTHYVQDLNGKIKSKKFKNYYEYYFSSEEVEAREVSKMITNKIYPLFH